MVWVLTAATRLGSELDWLAGVQVAGFVAAALKITTRRLARLALNIFKIVIKYFLNYRCSNDMIDIIFLRAKTSPTGGNMPDNRRWIMIIPWVGNADRAGRSRRRHERASCAVGPSNALDSPPAL